MNLKEKTYLWYVVLLRLYIGYYMLQQGVGKYRRNFPHGDWIGRQIGDIPRLDLYPWYKSFLLNTVVPHRELFGYLIMTGEIVVGSLLIIGLCTRVAAVIGLFLMINYFLGPGMGRGGAPVAQQQTFVVCFIVFLLSNPGRVLGLDGLLFRRG